MTDQELRSTLLAHLYAERSKDFVQIGGGASSSPEQQEKIRIAQQLSEAGLIEFKMLNRHVGGMARIKALGVDVMEGTASTPAGITIDRRQTINVTGSSNFQIGDENQQMIEQGLSALIQRIEQADGTDQEKKEAKSLLPRFLAHPLVAATAGAAVGGLVALK